MKIIIYDRGGNDDGSDTICDHCSDNRNNNEADNDNNISGNNMVIATRIMAIMYGGN